MLLVLLVAVAFVAPPAVDELQEARSAFQAKDLARAETLLRGILSRNPELPEAVLLLGMTEFSLAEKSERERKPRATVLASFRRARETLLKARELQPEKVLPGLHHAVGYTWAHEGRFARAVGHYDIALRESPGNVNLLRLRGQCHLDRGAPEDALKDIEEAVAKAPRDLTVRGVHGDVLFALGRHDDARRSFRDYHALIASEPADSRQFAALYRIYSYSLLMNDLEACREPLEKACRIAPGNLAARAELGLLYYRLGAHDDAVPELEVVLAAPSAPPAALVKAHHYRGLIARHRDQLPKARRHFEKALAIAPNRADVLKAYGGVLRRLGETTKAREILTRFGEVVGLENEIRRHRNALLKTPRLKTARAELIRALAKLERWGDARKELAILERWHAGDALLGELRALVRGGQ